MPLFTAGIQLFTALGVLFNGGMIFFFLSPSPFLLLPLFLCFLLPTPLYSFPQLCEINIFNPCFRWGPWHTKSWSKSYRWCDIRRFDTYVCALDLGFPHWGIAVLLLHSNALQIIWEDEKFCSGRSTECPGRTQKTPFPKYTIIYVWNRLCSEEIHLLGIQVAGTVPDRETVHTDPGMEEKVKPDFFEEFPVVCSGLVRVWEARRTVRPEINDIEKSVAFCSKELWLFPAGITLSLTVVRRAVEAWSRTPVCGLRWGGRKVFTKSRSCKPKGLHIWWQGIWRGVDVSV